MTAQEPSPGLLSSILRAAPEESIGTLCERAVSATRISVTITDARAPDNALVWVNAAFTETTGYAFEDAVGRNCRFLQGERTDRAVVAKIRVGVAAGRPITATLLNYRRDGSAFWNELTISPVRDSAGETTHFVGVQADVTARVEAQQARDDALAQVAVAAERVTLLVDFGSRVAMSQQPEQVLQLLGDVLVPQVATWCIVYTTDKSHRLARPYLAHERRDADPDIAALVEQLRAVVPEQLQDTSPIWRVLNGAAKYVLISDYDSESPAITGAAADDRTSLVHKLGTRSVIAVPLLARNGIVGCVAMIADHSRPAFGTPELTLVRELAIRAGLMLENTQLYARERAAAATLQRSLLPRLPRIEGLSIAADYVPAADEAAVGGDWYDVFPLRGDAGVGVVVGDVMGHDIDSAARMGKLSTIFRSYGWPGSEPRTVLAAVDELLESNRNLDFLATCLYAKLTLSGTGATLRYSSAGHPPGIVRAPDGSTRILRDGRGPMIGISRLMPRGTQRPPDACVELGKGSTLICFTDGLTDAFAGEPDMDEGLAQLCRLTAELPADASPQTIIAAVTRDVVRHTDDVAVVALRID